MLELPSAQDHTFAEALQTEAQQPTRQQEYNHSHFTGNPTRSQHAETREGGCQEQVSEEFIF